MMKYDVWFLLTKPYKNVHNGTFKIHEIVPHVDFLSECDQCAQTESQC